jgi:hypothetical protein
MHAFSQLQGVARPWRNPVRTRVTLLDSSDALYIVFLAYTVKPMDNVVRFRHPCVGLVRKTHARTRYSGVRKTHRIDTNIDLVIGAGVKNVHAEPVIGTCVKHTG